jgi:hypothetical protein
MFVACLLAAALPATSAAFQTITIEPNGLEPGEVLVIRGDQGKTSDEITVRLDLETGELVLTHDILEPLPPECHAVGSGPPFKEVRCPALGIVGVYVYAGTGKDKVITHLESPTDALMHLLAFLGGESDFFEGGEEEDEVFDEEDGFGDVVALGGGDDYATMGGGPDVVNGGPGADFATLGTGDDHGFGGPGKDKFLGGPGKDRLYGGPAFDLLKAGLGYDRCFGGPGGAKPISCEIGVHYGRIPDSGF